MATKCKLQKTPGIVTIVLLVFLAVQLYLNQVPLNNLSLLMKIILQEAQTLQLN
jgi:hypothetical protein